MKIAYSVFRNSTTSVSKKGQTDLYQQQLQAHNEVCQRYRHEIKEIQKWLPGWTPTLHTITNQ